MSEAVGEAVSEAGPGPLARRLAPRACRRLVVKAGSSLLVGDGGVLDRAWADGLAADLAQRRAAGQQLLLVSSGAVALGARRLGLAAGGRASLEDAQAAAATGQILLAGAWAEALGSHGLVAAQVLVTLADFEDRRRWLNITATLGRLLALGVVPVLNENDAVATEEIRFGDNDRLAARVAQAVGADAVLLLSDVDALYTADPATDPAARPLSLMTDLAAARSMATGGSASGMGRGGMASKVEAAVMARAAGIALGIASGRGPRPLARLDREGGGTLVPAGPPRAARKAWLSGRLRVAGRLRVDEGAAAALRAGRSLLAAGVTAVEGVFQRGDVVDIAGSEGGVLARGLVEYDSDDARLAAGRTTGAIAEVLPGPPRRAMVHRDHLAMLDAHGRGEE